MKSGTALVTDTLQRFENDTMLGTSGLTRQEAALGVVNSIYTATGQPTIGINDPLTRSPGFQIVESGVGAAFNPLTYTPIIAAQTTRMTRLGLLDNGPVRNAGNVLGQVDDVALRRLQLGAEIEVPAGTQGIRTMMSDLSVVSGNETALVRMQSGRRVLVMGEPNAVRLPPHVERVIAHTHPRGSLRLSEADIRTLNRFDQRSTVLIAPREDFGVRVSVPRPGDN